MIFLTRIKLFSIRWLRRLIDIRLWFTLLALLPAIILITWLIKDGLGCMDCGQPSAIFNERLDQTIQVHSFGKWEQLAIIVSILSIGVSLIIAISTELLDHILDFLTNKYDNVSLYLHTEEENLKTTIRAKQTTGNSKGGLSVHENHGNDNQNSCKNCNSWN